ncbi:MULTISPECIES: 50S ribosomal protein L6 [Thermoactinomyces]|uniref:Large ribosomal subunit protein uL6 n=1 Tax=Thermoactinomyces daqus TaxID=1329516 RepID=A0A7W1X915_9BACL|nr:MULTISPECIES: 50S ribosomal protein L6 [Thermoactinomyces]MBA4542342.1 50S ribosomal protein L6 [Thermoactinomyces daqus]MBH8598871.1 50S ribosomal protein L6 [Thermoactinomyces sp. CICC 10523]MBH8604856.1 50S ribosomal protein L6 [Thermoactinomyces sp. CICC 10522]MBH8607318.1 50S ribosomal protein L6 [Thermoactinomyces sp. CICC 10521]
MSRIGKKPVVIPNGVEVKLEGNTVTVKGPKGTLTRNFHSDIAIKVEDNQVIVERPSDHRTHRALHGTTRSVIANMVEGVTNGFSKTLELVGVGYRASKKGNNVVLNVGYSHPIDVTPIDGIELDVPSQTQIVVKGIDKEKVGEMAAKIRSYREPEPYKGKGIKYSDEVIRRKEGKTGK